MVRGIVFILVVLGVSLSVEAGGYLTNTNQSINFLRNPSRDASIGVDGVYYNPAGVVFMEDGWHLQFNWQIVRQDRDTKTAYGDLFKLNEKKSDATHKFEGDVKVPIQPAIYLTYNKNKWAFEFGAGFIGGGGGCEFNNGLGTFEALVGNSGLVALGNKMKSYSFDSYLKGESYDLGFTLGAARRVTDKISVYAAMRGIYAINKYQGYIRNIKYGLLNGGNMPVSSNYELDCSQTGFGLAPIIGFDYKLNNHWNFATKFEFRTKLRVKSNSHNSDDFTQLASSNPMFSMFNDGEYSRIDLPAMLTFGACYSPIQSLRIMGGYHHYFDVDTKQWGADLLGNTNEFTLGTEYDINKKWEVSAGWQKTLYSQEDKNLSDISFCLNSWSYGLGVGYILNKTVKFNVAWFQTLYHDKNVNNGKSNVVYSRTNKVLGLGVDISF